MEEDIVTDIMELRKLRRLKTRNASCGHVGSPGVYQTVAAALILAPVSSRPHRVHLRRSPAPDWAHVRLDKV